MIRISNTSTIFYKLFVPIFWAVFFGSFFVAIWISDEAQGSVLGITGIKIVGSIMYILGLILLYFTIFQFKRVEYNTDSLYITDYFTHVNIPLDSIEKIQVRDWIIFKTGHLKLKFKGRFGDKIRLIICQEEFPKFQKLMENV